MGRLDRWIESWRGAALAALIAVAAGLPGLIALPTLDRNEARFVQATSQMLETGDFTAIRFQERLRGGAAPGGHWLQAAAVTLIADPESRSIWIFRLWSLAGAALTAAACVWGGAPLFGRGPAFLAGASLGASFVLGRAAGMATADALFAGACALMIAAFARIYVANTEGRSLRRRDRVFLWVGLIAAVLIKGFLPLALIAFAGASLFALDRRADWFKRLGLGWGLLALAALAGPWVVAVTVATDGQFWAPLGPPATQGEWPGWQTLDAALLMFPATALFPFAVAYAWDHRKTVGVRVALCWLIPGWLMFEFMPGRQVFSTLPLYIALMWLGAAGLLAPRTSRLPMLFGAALSALAGLGLAAASIWLAGRFGQATDLAVGGLSALLFVGAGVAAAIAVLRPASAAAPPMIAALLLSLAAQGWMTGVLLPRLDGLWATRQTLRALHAAALDPREGLAVGPVASTGYSEPSLVFALGAKTETGDGALAAQAIAEGRPAIVEAAETGVFQAALRRLGVRADVVDEVAAYDYVLGRDLNLTIYRRRE